MLRSSLYAAGALLLSASAFAQNDSSWKVQPVTSQVKHGGTFHAATKTWTRTATPTANFGPDTLYDNTCSVGFYAGLSSGETMVDSGRLPSPSSPDNVTSETGTSTSYTINGFQVAYCTFEGPTVDLQVAHFNAYSPCSDATLLTPVSSVAVTGAPGAAVIGSQACWIINVDLQNTTLEFMLGADQDGTFDSDVTLDNFGWSWLQTTPPLNGNAGPLIAGDPFGILGGGTSGTGCPYGDGTVFAANGTTEGTGIGSDDVFETDMGGVMAGCWFFGGYNSGNPYASFWHEMYGDAQAPPSEPGVSYCNADGSGTTPCPCGNNNNGAAGAITGPAGCRNTNNAEGGALRATGTASVGGSTVVLSATNLDPGQPGLYFQADNSINGGNGIAFGDGLRCAGGNVVRLQVRIANASGASSTTVNIATQGGVAAGQTKRYQNWYRNPTISACGAGFNLTNGYQITWAP